MKRSLVHFPAMTFFLAAVLAGCAPRGSSFETLGIPVVEEFPGMGSIVVGWARESREGWVVERVRVEKQFSNEWNATTQEPAVIYLDPGDHYLRLYASQYDDPVKRLKAQRRIKLRPVNVGLAEGEVQLCTIELDGERKAPRMSCAHYLGSKTERADVDERHDPAAPPDGEGKTAGSAEVSETAGTAGPGGAGTNRSVMNEQLAAGVQANRVLIEQMLLKLELIEHRLGDLWLKCPSNKQGVKRGVKELSIDTSFPWGGAPAVP